MRFLRCLYACGALIIGLATAVAAAQGRSVDERPAEKPVLSPAEAPVWHPPLIFSPEADEGSSFDGLRMSGRTRLRLLTGPTELVTSVAYAPDGRTLAAGSAERLVRLLDSQTRTVRQVLAAAGTPRALAWSPDGSRLAASIEASPPSAGIGSGLVTWSADGSVEWSVNLPARVSARSMAYSADGKSLVAGLSDGTMRTFDAASGKSLRTTTVAKSAITSVALAHDGVYMATVDGTAVRIWDARSGKQLRVAKSTPSFDKLRMSGAPVVSVAFSPDSRVLAGGTTTGRIRFWTVLDGDEVAHIDGHLGAIRSLVFSGRGDRLVTASDDKTVRLWDIMSGTRLQEFSGHRSAVLAVAVNSEAHEIASAGADGVLFLWDDETGQPRLKFFGPPDVLASLFFVSGADSLVGLTQSGVFSSWDPLTGVTHWERFAHSSPARAMVVTPDGRYVVTAGGLQDDNPGSARQSGAFTPLTQTAARGDLKVWGGVEGNEIRDLGGHAGVISALAISGNGRTLVSASDAGGKGDILIWDLQAAAVKARVGGELGPVRSLTFAAGTDVFAAGSSDGSVVVMDPRTPAVRQTIRVTGEIGRVALSGDGRTLATASLGAGGASLVQLWDVPSGTLSKTLWQADAPITSLALSPDGWYLLAASALRQAQDERATGPGEARLWLVQTAELVGSVSAPAGLGFAAAAFAPDAHAVALGCTDKSIRIWQAK